MSSAVLDPGLPPLDPRSAPALLSAFVEQLLTLDLSPEKAALVFTALVERWLSLPGTLGVASPIEDSWKEWFDFSDSFSAPSARSYLEILEDEDRRE